MTFHHDHDVRLSNLEDILRKLTEKSEVFILLLPFFVCFACWVHMCGSERMETEEGIRDPALTLPLSLETRSLTEPSLSAPHNTKVTDVYSHTQLVT